MIYQPRRPARHETLTVRGLEHRLTWWGKSKASPIVLLHGFMDTSETWQFVVDHLPDDWNLVAFDWRGFGSTDRSPGLYWFPDYFADLEAILDAVMPHERARVVGHSMGGNVAAMYAGIRTQRLQWLVSLEGVGLRRSTPSQAPEHYEKWLDQLKDPPRQKPYPSVEALVRVLRARNPRLTPDRAEFIATAWTRRTEQGYELASDPMHRLVNANKYRREEAEACWQRAEIPLLMVLGELSDLLPHLGPDSTPEYMRSVYRRIEIVTMAGVGHMMHHEDPGAVAALIRKFAEESDEPREYDRS
jgi:pimeloyl-ACP methyl ester carboxylesterase